MFSFFYTRREVRGIKHSPDTLRKIPGVLNTVLELTNIVENSPGGVGVFPKL